ncbi:hypothetical protein K458DRAFT_437605 [Lentithecium fluviatile CBS 122367]|uniref:Rhodopsin domain-containing protein n=1 Tax=Lentithecium fluviatile CBS 122367 TaxID=1168545 RepID=A0A6G1ICP3_9PLEO|nr:hypothetical protein K458DRAFT_437605 [Lentithecium fluviatile CBS 122367]
MVNDEPHEWRLQPSSISKNSVLIAVWLIASITTVALLARLYTRYWRFTRLYWDDFFCVLGWAFSIPLAIQATLASGPPAALGAGHGGFFLSRPMTQILFYTSLWSIKISFLIFFRRIGICALPALRRYWIGVFCFTALTYGLTWMLNPYACWVKKGVLACEHDGDVGVLRPVAFRIATIFDVVTDCLIVAIPFVVLFNVRLSVRKKLVLYSLFSLEVITILVAIGRCVVVTRGMISETMSVSLLLLLTHVAASTAVVVACIGSLRSLFTQDARTRNAKDDSPGYRSGLSRRRQQQIDSTVLTELPYYSPKYSDTESTLKSPDAIVLGTMEHNTPFDHGNLLGARP